MKCPVCGRETRDDSRFCEKCGQKIPRCPKCGKVIVKRMKFCTNDGTPLPPEVLAVFPEKAEDGGRTVGTAFGAPRPTVPSSPVSEAPKKKKTPLVAILIGLAAVIFISLCAFGGYMAASGKLASLFGQTDMDDDADDDEAPGRRHADRSDSGDDDEKESQAKTTAAAETTTAAETTSAEAQTTVAALETTTAFAAAESNMPEDKLIYFIENSDRETFTSQYLESFDADMCRLARNGIYARLGRKFKDAALMEYFGQYDWYNPAIEPENFSDSMLNGYQVANRDLIVAYEAKMGYNK